MGSVTDKKISRAFSKAAKWQIIITLLISCVSLLLAGVDAALSAIAGGASVVIGAYVAMQIASRSSGNNPGGMLITLLKAEAVKILVTAVLLLVIFKNYHGLVPLALIGGLAGSALAAGAGLRTVNNENNE